MTKHQRHLHSGIIIALTILIFLLLGFIFKLNEINNYRTFPETQEIYEKDGPQVVPPRPIEKTDEIADLEQELIIKREITIDPDTGNTTITAYIENIEALPKNLIIADLVETIRFEQRVKLIESQIESPTGTLFPAGNELIASTYGVGIQSERNTKLNITVLDINLSKKSTDTTLYKTTFKTSEKFDKIKFDQGEIRINNNILKLNSDEISDF